MRQKQRLQTSIFDYYAEHEIGNELKMISLILDRHREILDWVEKDICAIVFKKRKWPERPVSGIYFTLRHSEATSATQL